MLHYCRFSWPSNAIIATLNELSFILSHLEARMLPKLGPVLQVVCHIHPRKNLEDYDLVT